MQRNWRTQNSLALRFSPLLSLSPVGIGELEASSRQLSVHVLRNHRALVLGWTSASVFIPTLPGLDLGRKSAWQQKSTQRFWFCSSLRLRRQDKLRVLNTCSSTGLKHAIAEAEWDTRDRRIHHLLSEVPVRLPVQKRQPTKHLATIGLAQTSLPPSRVNRPQMEKCWRQEDGRVRQKPGVLGSWRRGGEGSKIGFTPIAPSAADVAARHHERL